MQDRLKVGDYVIFRRGMHKVADMLNTSFYDVLTSVYEITGTEGRCYLMKSEKGRGRVWKIRKSRIARLGTRVTVVNDMAVVTADERRGSHLVSKSEKEYMEALVNAREKTDEAKRNVIAAALIKDVAEKLERADRILKAMFRLTYAGPPINIKNLSKLKGHWPNANRNNKK